MKINQYDIFWTDLDPTRGSEISKIRPCLVVSPIEMNHNLATVIVAPLTSRGRAGYPTRVHLDGHALNGWIVLNQLRAIDKTRLREYIQPLGKDEIASVKGVLKEMLID